MTSRTMRTTTDHPPRMRGKQVDAPGNPQLRRITPAHAGKTKALAKQRQAVADHPRACGENDRDRILDLTDAGSPPRMRGKHIEEKQTELQRRITPAHAGKTRVSLSSDSPSPDHPRACGENEVKNTKTGRVVGSPPRMRGKPADFCDAVAGLRITPAHAGKTSPAFPPSHQSSDHPRACGENTSEMAYFRG